MLYSLWRYATLEGIVQIEPDKLTGLIVSSLVNRHRMMPPYAFTAWLCGMIANVAAAIPDEYWAQMMKVEPCDTPGCDCYKDMDVMVRALDVQRDAHRRLLPPTRTE